MLHEVCITCGTPFSIPANLQSQLRNNHKTFYCPNGHDQAYVVKSESEKLRFQLTETMAREQRLIEELAAKNRKLAKAERGVCIHCHRTFNNVVRHMKSKHGKP
jgi:hypothetical protein